MHSLWISIALIHIFEKLFSVFQFFTGWWILIDAWAVYPGYLHAVHIILGILGTISLIMVNSVTQAQVKNFLQIFRLYLRI